MEQVPGKNAKAGPRKKRGRGAKEGRYTKAGVWDKAGCLTIQRLGFPTMKFENLDPGVTYFVAMLDQLGLETHFSCEGHPNGFYITFTAPYAVALKIKKCGYFSTEIESENTWSIRINHPHNAKGHIDCLRWAAHAWEKTLGPLDFDKIVLKKEGQFPPQVMDLLKDLVKAKL